MKILVPIKRVVDYNVKVRPLSDQSNVDLNNVKMSVNPFCEIALEEASSKAISQNGFTDIFTLLRSTLD